MSNKKMPPPCRCGLYPLFPHRRSERCAAAEREDQEMREKREFGVQSTAEIAAEELAVFDRAEARAINNGFN